MNVLHSANFPEPHISRAGLGSDPDLCWWLTQRDESKPHRINVGRRRGNALVPLGTVVPSSERLRARFTRDGRRLMVISDKMLYCFPLENAATSVEMRDLGDDSVVDLDSYDGRVAFLARSLRWPPVWRLDTASGHIASLAPRRHEVSKHHPLLALSPDGGRLAFGHVFDALEIFALASGESIPWPQTAASIPDLDLRSSDLLAHLDFTADGKHLVAVSQPRQAGRPHILRVGDADGQNVRDYPLSNHLPTVAVAAGGRLAAAARRDSRGTVDILDLASGETRSTGEVGSRVFALAIDPTAGRLTVAHADGISVLSTELA
jgi:hypothetical protein